MEETVPEITVLPQAKRGHRPLPIGEKLNSAVKSRARNVHEASGIVTSYILAAAATAMVRKDDAKLLTENGGPLSITTIGLSLFYIACSLLKEEVALIRKSN